MPLTPEANLGGPGLASDHGKSWAEKKETGWVGTAREGLADNVLDEFFGLNIGHAVHTGNAITEGKKSVMLLVCFTSGL